jgi:hypothetical protein
MLPSNVIGCFKPSKIKISSFQKKCHDNLHNLILSIFTNKKPLHEDLPLSACFHYFLFNHQRLKEKR